MQSARLDKRGRRRGPSPGTPAHDAMWRAEKLGYLPPQWRKSVAALHVEKLGRDGEFAGNTWLRELADSVRRSGGLPLDASDTEIRAYARDLAASADEVLTACPIKTWQGVRDALSGWARSRGVTPPGDDVECEGAVLRLLDADWWVRQLRKAHGRRIETHAIELGYVHRRAGCYVSDVNVNRRRDQRRRNAKLMRDTELENQFGDRYTLEALSDLTTANPRIRRGELMTRIAGSEVVARDMGHAAEFVTVTCPSCYHAVLSRSGDRNPKYQPGLTPRDAQAHLVKAWSLCRSALNRRGIFPYGFRIAEPHHDGCPHWHMILFMSPDHVEEFRRLVRKYFLERHQPNEPGARKNRCKFVAIDPAKGSAAGYVAKYVAKNIDGMGIETDLLGNDAIVTAERVDAWASTWGIRQFQPVGGAPVGAWRELRRLTEAERLPDAAEACRVAADAGDWGAYLMAQGGPVVRRKDLTVRAAMSPEGERWDAEVGCMGPAENRYCEPAPGSVFGVAFQGRGGRCTAVSRRYKWRRKSERLCVAGSADRRTGGLGKEDSSPVAVSGVAGVGAGYGLAGSNVIDGAPVGAHGEFAGCAGKEDSLREGVARGLRVSGGAERAPWTRVNNCTQGVTDGRFGKPNAGHVVGASAPASGRNKRISRNVVGDAAAATGCDAVADAGGVDRRYIDQARPPDRLDGWGVIHVL